MRIESYEFGEITIDGKVYTSDVIIYPDYVDSSWWRKEGHNVALEDLKEVIAKKPHILIIGTGYSGLMRVPAEVENELLKEGIQTVIDKTETACKIFNELRCKYKDKIIIAALHLTC